MKSTRKINKVGKDTLTISLPKTWVRKNNIKPGMVLETEELNNSLVVRALSQHDKKYVINLGILTTFTLEKLINELYIQNADTITINLTSDKILNSEQNKDVDIIPYIDNLVSMHVGLEVVSQDEKKIVIQSLLKAAKTNDIKDIRERIASLYIETLTNIMGLLRNSQKRSESRLKSQVQTIRKFIYYYMRVLFDVEYDQLKKIKLYTLYYHLDNFLYKVPKIVVYLKQWNEKLGQRMKGILEETVTLFVSYLRIKEETVSEAYIEELVKKREALVEKANSLPFTMEEETTYREFRMLLNLQNDFVRAYLNLVPEFIEKELSQE